jgi:hypothetical protein
MDREISKEEIKKRRNKKIIRAGAIVLIIFTCFIIVEKWLGQSVNRADLTFSTVDRGTIEVSVNASGKVVPIFEEIINSPINSRIIETYKKSGDIVEAGTPILKLDLQSAETDYQKGQDDEQMRISKLQQLKVDRNTKLTFPEYINKASRLLQKEDKMNIKKAVKYIKMFAIPNQQYDTIKPFVEEAVAKESRTITDGGHNLIKLKELVKEHIPYPETEEDVHEVVKTKLPWVHIITGECRSGIEVIHKDVDKRFLQLYLNEYCWKFNRRFFRDRKKEKFDLFDHLIRISAQYTSDIKWRDYEKMANAINIC